MDDDEVSEFSMRVDIDALSAYHAAVGKRTEKIVEALTPEDLDEVANPSEIRKAISDEALLRENAGWVEGNFSGRPKGWFLAQLGLAHNYGDTYGANTVRSPMGISGRRPKDDEHRPDGGEGEHPSADSQDKEGNDD